LAGQRTPVACDAFPVALTVAARAVRLHASLIACVGAVLALFASGPRVRAVACAHVRKKGASVFAVEIADLTLVPSKPAGALTRAVVLVQDAAIEAPGGALFALVAFCQRWAVALARFHGAAHI